MPVTPIPFEALAARIGTGLGVSGWRIVDQDLIDRFAAVTGDRQFIHVDPVRAAAPLGGTVAHGFLTLPLLPALAEEALPAIEGQAMAFNDGFERIRFLAPVPAGSRLRARFRLRDLTMRRPREALIRYEVVVDLEGSAKPALAADWLTLALPG